MISFSKSKFAVLGFLFIAVLLIPANDAFADHTNSIALTTTDHLNGDVAIFELHGDGGIYDVFDEIKVWIDKDNVNGNSEQFKQFGTNGGNQSPIEVIKINDAYYQILVSIDTMTWGTLGEHKVKIDAIQTRHGPTRTLGGGDGISLIVGNSTSTLTITNLSHYNCDSPAPPNHNQNWCNGTDHYRIDVDGSTTGFAPSQPLTFKIIDSNGNTVRDYSSFYGTQSGPPGFGYEGPVFYNSTFTEQYNGSFTVTICAPEFDVCDAESFTINSIVEDPDADTTPPIIVLPANYQVTAPSGSTGAESVITQTFDVILYDDPIPDASTGEVLTWGPTSPKSCSYNSGMTGADPEYLALTWKEDVQITSTQWKTTFQVEDFFDIGPNTITCTATDESGNNATASFTITVEEAPLSNVDLEFGNIPSMVPEPPGVDKFYSGTTSAKLSGIVRNTGQGIAPQVIVGFNVLSPTGSSFMYSDMNAMNGQTIGPGQSKNLSWQSYSYAGLGTYTYTLTIDPDNNIAETNENNNVFTGSFEVVEEEQFPVDLEFGAITSMVPEPPGVDKFYSGTTSAKLSGIVRNTGQGIAPQVIVGFNVLSPTGSSFMYSDMNAMNGQTIGPGQSKNLSWQSYSYAGLGTYTYTLTIDPDNNIAETNENNNVYTGSFEVVEEEQFPVDLEFGNIPSMVPEPPGVDKFYSGTTSAKLSGIVRNTGQGIAPQVIVGFNVLSPTGSSFMYSDMNAMNGQTIGPGQSKNLSWQSYSYAGLGTYTYTLTIDPDNNIAETNENNNVYTGSFEVVEFVDLTIPTVNVPDDITLSAPSTYPDWYTQNTRIIEASEFTGNYPPTGTDTLDGIIDSSNVICTEPNSGFLSGDLPGADGGLKLHFWPVGVNTVTCEATNSAGKTGSASFTITITEASADATPPTFTSFTDGSPYSGAEDLLISASITNPSLQYNTTNSTGESITFWMRVADNEADTSPEKVALRNNVTCVRTDTNAQMDVIPIETGNYDVRFTELFLGLVSVACEVTDASGNVGFLGFTVDVILDTSAAEASAETTPPTFTYFSDHYSNQQLEISSSHASPIFQYHITNSSINVGFLMQVADNEANTNPEELALIESVTCIIGDELEAWNVPIQANLTVNAWGINFYENFPADNLTSVRCSVTDAVGNVGWLGFNIDVVLEGSGDTTPPVVTVAPANISLDAITHDGYTQVHYETGKIEFTGQGLESYIQDVYWDVTASDDVDGLVSPTCSILGVQYTLTPEYDASDGTNITFYFPIGTTTVRCTATDAAGNVGTGSFTVTVVLEGAADTTPPTFTSFTDGSPYSGAEALPISASITNPNLQYNTTNSTGESITFWMRVADNEADTSPEKVALRNNVTCVRTDTNAQMDVIPIETGNYDVRFTETFLGLVSVACEVTDASGNVGFLGFTVDVILEAAADTTPPVIITDSDMTIFVTNSSKIPVSYATARATDNVGITAQPTCTPSSGSLFSVGTHFVYCIAYDNVGLKGEKSFKITIINTNAEGDNQPPVFTQKQDITTDATISNGATVKFELPKVTDDTAVTSGPTCFVDGIPIPIVSDESTLEFFFDIGPTTVECIAYDAENNKGATTFTVTVKSLNVPPVKIPFDVTVSTNTSYYDTEDAVFVTGISTPFTEKSISINVKDQLNELVHREQLIPKLINDVPTGTYEGIIFPTILWDTSGNYTMSATYGDATDSVPFTFEYIQTENNNSNIPTGITLNVNETGYAIGDTISVTSQLTGGTSGQSITIDVKNESGYSEILKPLNTDDSGSISYSFKSQDNWEPGKYSITASAVDPNASGDDTALWDWSTSESIQIVKPLPKITIAPTIATTESGDVIASYKAGEIGYFSTSLLSDSTSNVLVTISVLDAEDTTLGVTFFKSVIGKGDSKIVLGFKIPEDAADGAAKIYVNTYTDWPDQGGIPISSELLSEVNIEGITAAAAEAAEAAAEAEAATAEAAAAEAAAAEAAAAEAAAAENMIPKFLSVLDVVQTTSSEDGSIVSYKLPIATGGVIPSDTICKPASGSKFIIGSTQVKCEATNDFGTGKTFFMVTVNQQIPDQTLSVKVGNNSYDNEEPIFVIGSVGKVTGGTINLQVTDSLNNLVFMKSITPKPLGTYSTVIESNELWRNPGEYTVLTTYGSATAQDTFEFEIIEVESFTAELIPTSLSVDTDNSVYVLGDNVFIDMKLLGAGAGESILLDIRDSQNDQVFLNSLNTDSNGIADISYPLEPTQNSGIYSVIASSNVWDFTSTATFVAVAQIADITIGDVIPTLQDGTEVDSFKIGNLGYFQTPVISNSTSNVLIAVTVFDVENTPLGLAYFESKIVNDAFNITLGLEIPEDAAPGLATVYINTYTDWPDKGGVSILEEQVSFIEITPSSISDLVVSNNSTSTNSTSTNSTSTNSTSTNSTSTNSTSTNSTSTNSTSTNSTSTNSTSTNSTDASP